MNRRRGVITTTDQGIRILAGILLAMIEGKEFNEDKVKGYLKELADQGYIFIEKHEQNGDRDGGNDESGD